MGEFPSQETENIARILGIFGVKEAESLRPKSACTVSTSELCAKLQGSLTYMARRRCHRHRHPWHRDNLVHPDRLGQCRRRELCCILTSNRLLAGPVPALRRWRRQILLLPILRQLAVLASQLSNRLQLQRRAILVPKTSRQAALRAVGARIVVD